MLGKTPARETFHTLTLFAAELGGLRAHVRVSKKAGAVISADLFDEGAFLLEGGTPGKGWFVREARLLQRFTGIGSSYASLRRASEFARLVAQNEVPEESRGKVYALLKTAFAAFGAGAPADVVYFKGVYSFARDEGYPLRQQWLPTLPHDLRENAQSMLAQPLSFFADPGSVPPSASILVDRLIFYLQGHTDLRVS